MSYSPMPAAPSLPIVDVLEEISRTLETSNRLILAAPPGAGKTTLVPLSIAGLDALPSVIDGRILLLEPRRVAARMAAQRMAATLGERVGQQVGLSTRIDRKVSSETLIEVITDGLFARRILSDPELKGIGAVIFDEFHERRLNGDMGLALAIDAQGALREDLRLVLMSATLETTRIAGVLDAPSIESAGRQYPVETRYLGRSRDRIEDQMVRAIGKALREQDGSILAFLPGAGDIRRVQERLDVPGKDIVVAPLFGALSPGEQDAAVAPVPAGQRKIVLATDLAESSLTIEGVTIVIDSGLARVAEDDPGGLGSRLSTVKASRASVDQRRGRAGRTAPGVCYRLWDEAATRGLTPAPVPEILTSDLAGLVLALAEWGEADAQQLTWIDRPAEGRLAAGRQQLTDLGALDSDGRLTPLGREMSGFPLPPRLAALVASAPEGPQRALAAEIAALAGERGVGGSSADLCDRLAAFRADRSGRAKALKSQARRWGGGDKPSEDLGGVLARAWPMQIARRREGDAATYLLASGRAGRLADGDGLGKSDWLVVIAMGGGAREARITLAMPISEAEALAAGHVSVEETATFSSADQRIQARRVKRLGAIVLSETALPKPERTAAARAILAAVLEEGFEAIGAGDVIAETGARLGLLASAGVIDHAPGDGTWLETAEDWLLPLLVRAAPGIPRPHAVREALCQQLDWPLQQALRDGAPLFFELPTGQRAEIDYLDDRAPVIAARAQAFFGTRRHPVIAEGRIPLTVDLLSPARRMVASTQDLPAFWGAGYSDMAKDMRSQYPKHDWPDDPAAARPHEGLTKKRLSGGR